MSKQIWIAKTPQGKYLALTEREALTHFENNNISQRMRLEFIGVSDGQAYKKKQLELHEENKEKLNTALPPNAPEPEHIVKLKEEIEQQSLEAEAEVARANGMKTPDKGLNTIVSGTGVSQETLNRLKQRYSR